MSPFVLFVAVVCLPPCIFALWRCRPSWENVFVYCLCACRALVSVLIEAPVCLSVSTWVSVFTYMAHACILHPPLGLACVFTYITYVHVYPVTLSVRVTIVDLVAEAARGGLLTWSHGRGASFSPAYRKQTS